METYAFLPSRNPIPKAWTSGRNPITQRSNTPGQSNGAGPQPQSTGKPSAAQEINPASKLVNHDRLLWLMTTSMVSVTLCNGPERTFSKIRFLGSKCHNRNDKPGCLFWPFLGSNYRQRRVCISTEDGASSQDWRERAIKRYPRGYRSLCGCWRRSQHDVQHKGC